MVTRGSEEVLVEAFDPSLEEDRQWTLRAVNGEAPDPERLQQHREKKRQELEENPPKRFEELVDFSSLRRVAENRKEARYQFKPLLFDDKPELNERFLGTIVIGKSDRAIREMEYRNTEKIKPSAVVSLDTLYTKIEYQTLADGQPVAKTISIHSQGSAFVFKRFDEKVVQEYSNYRRVIHDKLAVGKGAASDVNGIDGEGNGE